MKICEAGRSAECCSNPRLRTINTMGPDTDGNFTVRGVQGIHVTTGTNEIIISGVAVYYDNTDGNLEIDNDLMTINLADDIVITGDLTVNGTYYTVHAEHVYTEDDYIVMRDGATTGLSPGQYSGFEIVKYDGTNNGRLVIDSSGVARVGDVNDEQPLLTREEVANLNNGALLKWDATNQKAVDEGTVGSDIRPIKIVNGVATPVTNILIDQITNQTITADKKFTQAIKSGDYAQLTHYEDTNSHRVMLSAYNNNIEGRIELRVMNDGTVQLFIRKVQNGTYTDYLIHQF